VPSRPIDDPSDTQTDRHRGQDGWKENHLQEAFVAHLAWDTVAQGVPDEQDNEQRRPY